MINLCFSDHSPLDGSNWNEGDSLGSLYSKMEALSMGDHSGQLIYLTLINPILLILHSIIILSCSA